MVTYFLLRSGTLLEKRGQMMIFSSLYIKTMINLRLLSKSLSSKVICPEKYAISLNLSKFRFSLTCLWHCFSLQVHKYTHPRASRLLSRQLQLQWGEEVLLTDHPDLLERTRVPDLVALSLSCSLVCFFFFSSVICSWFFALIIFFLPNLPILI